MQIRSGVDWLRYTVPETTGKAGAVPAHKVFLMGDVMEKSLPWYNSAVSLGCGRIDWHSQKPEQGIMVTMTGRDLQAMRDAGFSDQELIAHIEAIKAQVTRIDFAIDVKDSGRSPDEFAAMVDSGVLQCGGRSRLRWSSRKGNEGDAVTVQFGSRTSAKCLRVYDKAKESGARGDVIRYELETKGRAARSLVKAMHKYGIQPTGKKAMRAFISGEEPIWQEMTNPGRDDVEIEPVGRKDADWENWILTVALPNVVKAAKQGVPGVIETINREIFGEVPTPPA